MSKVAEPKVDQSKADHLLIDYLETLYNELKQIVSVDGKITIANILVIVNKIIVIVNTYKNFSNYEKGNLVIEIIKKYIENSVGSEYTNEEKEVLLLYVNVALPIIINKIIEEFTSDENTKNNDNGENNNDNSISSNTKKSNPSIWNRLLCCMCMNTRNRKDKKDTSSIIDGVWV